MLEHSSDVGAIKIALRLGEERFDRYIRAFGFGTQTRIELPGETRGITKPVSRWSKVSIGAISMGQEIGVSPVQLASMVSTIANDGLYVPPRIVAGTTAPRSTPQLIAFHPALGRRVISSLTAAADEAHDGRRGAARDGQRRQSWMATARPEKPERRRRLMPAADIRIASTSLHLPALRR